MPAFPLSLRLLATPLWALAQGRVWWRERSRPLLRARVTLRHPLPDAQALARVATASDVVGIHLVLEELHGGWATLQSARNALLRIRAAGKIVVVEMERCGNAELYLASAADRVWMRPMGEVHALGLGGTLRFAGAALAKVGLRFDMEAAGAYKSFGEQWTRSFASPANREATRVLVDELQAELEGVVAEGRGLPVEEVRRAIADGPLSADEALERHLIDAVGYGDACEASLRERIGPELSFLPFHVWWRAVTVRDRLEHWIEKRRRVVVLHLKGPVMDGEGPPGTPAIAAVPVSRALRDLADDDDVASVVLAINSPGGSALASDLIWREVSRLGTKKPLLAVFGDVAASGGYYIAAPAAEIWAQPGSLTGSIGVVGGKVVVADAMARVGVSTELILGAPNAAMYGPDAAFTPEQRLRFRASLERFYRGFVERVSAGRRRPYDVVEVHARGRVWTGRHALSVGLVDHLGGVEEAVARAGILAGVPHPARVDLYLAPRSTRLARLVRGWLETMMPELRLIPRLPPLATLLLNARGGILLLWPWEVEIR